MLIEPPALLPLIVFQCIMYFIVFIFAPYCLLLWNGRPLQHHPSPIYVCFWSEWPSRSSDKVKRTKFHLGNISRGTTFFFQVFFRLPYTSLHKIALYQHIHVPAFLRLPIIEAGTSIITPNMTFMQRSFPLFQFARKRVPYSPTQMVMEYRSRNKTEEETTLASFFPFSFLYFLRGSSTTLISHLSRR